MRRRHISKYALLVVGALLASLSFFMWWAVGKTLPTHCKLSVEYAPQYAHTIADDRGFTLASYNIAFAQGLKIHPTDWRDKAYTETKLAELCSAIQRLNADVLMLQEVDIESDRTFRINQAEDLRAAGKYPYMACALVWDENYLPFPFWPPEEHLGQAKTANCILSRFKLTDHERLVFPKPKANPFWYNWGYIDRAAQRVVAHVGQRTFTLVNVHLEAYDKEARQDQAQRLSAWLKDEKGPLIVGGDFNSIPPEASKKDHFIDEDIDFWHDDTIAILRQGFGGSIEVPSHDAPTFPSDTPTRRLDALFAANGASLSKGRVVSEAGTASDHLPVVAHVD